jgi:WD40 repeat protein
MAWQYLATTSFDGVLRLWEKWFTSAPREVTRLPHRTRVSDAEFSPGGRYLATASDDGVARVWTDWQTTRARIVSETPSNGSIMLVAFTADEKHFVCVDEEATITIWDAATGARESVPARKGRLTRDRKHLLVLEETTLRILEPPDGPEVARVANLNVDTDVSNVDAFDLSIEARYSALASDNVVAIRSLSDGRQVASLRHDSRVEELIFQPGDAGSPPELNGARSGCGTWRRPPKLAASYRMKIRTCSRSARTDSTSPQPAR